jgi:hypothetical protein
VGSHHLTRDVLVALPRALADPIALERELVPVDFAALEDRHREVGIIVRLASVFRLLPARRVEERIEAARLCLMFAEAMERPRAEGTAAVPQNLIDCPFFPSWQAINMVNKKQDSQKPSVPPENKRRVV